MNQAFQISKRLEARGVRSPVLTTYSDVDSRLPASEIMEGVDVTRFPVLFPLMRYCVSPKMYFGQADFDILHSHNYRNFPTDAGFFLPD